MMLNIKTGYNGMKQTPMRDIVILVSAGAEGLSPCDSGKEFIPWLCLRSAAATED